MQCLYFLHYFCIVHKHYLCLLFCCFGSNNIDIILATPAHYAILSVYVAVLKELFTLDYNKFKIITVSEKIRKWHIIFSFYYFFV